MHSSGAPIRSRAPAADTLRVQASARRRPVRKTTPNMRQRLMNRTTLDVLLLVLLLAWTIQPLAF